MPRRWASCSRHTLWGRRSWGRRRRRSSSHLWGAILRLRNILTSFDDFAGEEILTPRQVQDYTSVYLDLYAEFRKDAAVEKESITEDVVFEIELVKQVEINVDYILMLVEKYRTAKGDGEDREIKEQITRAIDASPSLRSKKDLIEEFVDSVSASGAVDVEWSFVARRREQELDVMIKEEGLTRRNTSVWTTPFATANSCWRHCTDRILPPMSRFAPDGAHAIKRSIVLPARLTTYVDRFLGLG